MALWLAAVAVARIAALARRPMAVDRRRLADVDRAAACSSPGPMRAAEASYLAVTEYSGFLWAVGARLAGLPRARLALHARRRGADRRRLPDRRARQAADPPEIDVAA